ncbi:MAG TPA: oligosaccharide flippase family protein [Anaerolineae bacterium]
MEISRVDTAMNTPSIARLDNAGLIARGTGISVAGLAAYSILQYLFLVIVARALGPIFYGLFNIGLATANVVVPLALIGLNFGLLRYVARYRTLVDAKSETRLVRGAFLLVTLSGTLVGVSMAFLAQPIAQFYDHHVSTLASLLRWFAPTIPLSAMLILLVSVFYGQKRVAPGVALQKMGQPALALLFAWSVLWLGAGISGVIQGYVVSLALAVLLALYLLRSYFLPASRPTTEPADFSLREVLGYSLPLVPVSFMRQFGNRLEIYLLGFLGSATDVAVFSAAAATAAFVVLGLKAILSIYSALAAELHTANDLRQLEYQLQMATRWSAALSLPPLIVIVLFGRDILGLFSDVFVVGYAALFAMAAGHFVNAATGPIDATLNMAGHSRLFLLNIVLILALNVALDWWLIPLWGITGAAVGSALALTALNLALTFEVQLLLGIRPYSLQLLRPLLAGGLTALVIWPTLVLLKPFAPLPRILVGSITTGLVYYLLFWIFAPEDERNVVKLVWLQVKTVVSPS